MEEIRFILSHVEDGKWVDLSTKIRKKCRHRLWMTLLLYIPAIIDGLRRFDVNRSGTTIKTINQLAILDKESNKVTVLFIRNVKYDSICFRRFEFDTEIWTFLQSQFFLEFQISFTFVTKSQTYLDVCIILLSSIQITDKHDFYIRLLYFSRQNIYRMSLRGRKKDWF